VNWTLLPLPLQQQPFLRLELTMRMHTMSMIVPMFHIRSLLLFLLVLLLVLLLLLLLLLLHLMFLMFLLHPFILSLLRDPLS
jgi:hypothetical protein